MEEIDIKQELESNEANPPLKPAIDPKHQFNDAGMHYESRHHIWLWLLVFVLTAGAVGYFLGFTETGAGLLNQARQAISSSSSSAQASQSLSSSSATSSIAISGREFDDLPFAQVQAQILADLEKASEISVPESVFEDFDSEAELGTTANTSTSTASSKTSSKTSSRYSN